MAMLIRPIQWHASTQQAVVITSLQGLTPCKGVHAMTMMMAWRL
jgi:hypothetical protein